MSLYHQSQLLHMLDFVGFNLNTKKSGLDLVQDIQFLGILLRLDLGKALLPESKARKIVARMCEISSQPVLSYQRVSQFMGSLRSHPIGSSTSEATTKTLSFFRSDKPVYTTALVRPIDPCLPTPAQAGPIFSYLGNSQRTFPGRLYDIYGRLYTGMGAHMGDSQIWDTWTCTDLKLHIISASGPPDYDHYGQYNSSFLYQQTRKDPLPLPVTSSSGSLYVASSSEHGSQSQPCLNVLADRLSRPNQPITTEWSLHSEIVARIFQT